MSTQYPAPPQAPVQQPAGIATASVVLGAVGFLVGICSVIGLILGLVARGKAQRGEISPARVKTGIVVSSISLGLGILGWIGLIALAGGSDTTTTTTIGAASAPAVTSQTPTPVETSTPPVESAAELAPEPAVESAASEAPVPSATEEAPTASGIGQAVIADDVAYTVTSFDCGIAQVGTEYFNRTAQGEYCEAVVDIKNEGTRSTMFDSSQAKAYIGDVEYASDGQASMYADDGNAFLTDINPGNTVTTKLYFDVPAGSHPDRVEIGAGLFSKGAIISVA